MSREHGRYSTYTNGRCRCDLCKAAARRYMRAYRGEPQITADVIGDAMDTLTRTRSVKFAAEQAGVNTATIRSWATRARCMPARKLTGPTHGNASTYRSPVYRCRCDACTAAHTEAVRRETKARAQRQNEAAAHGTASTYGNWGCRCDACFAAQAIANRDARSGKPRRRLKVEVSER